MITKEYSEDLRASLKETLKSEADKAARIAVRMCILEHTWHMVHRTGDPVAPALGKLKGIERW